MVSCWSYERHHLCHVACSSVPMHSHASLVTSPAAAPAARSHRQQHTHLYARLLPCRGSASSAAATKPPLAAGEAAAGNGGCTNSALPCRAVPGLLHQLRSALLGPASGDASSCVRPMGSSDPAAVADGLPGCSMLGSGPVPGTECRSASALMFLKRAVGDVALAAASGPLLLAGQLPPALLACLGCGSVLAPGLRMTDSAASTPTISDLRQATAGQQRDAFGRLCIAMQHSSASCRIVAHWHLCELSIHWRPSLAQACQFLQAFVSEILHCTTPH